MILAIVGVIVLLYVFVSMYSATLERRREIATMRALGARRTTVLGIVLAESVARSRPWAASAGSSADTLLPTSPGRCSRERAGRRILFSSTCSSRRFWRASFLLGTLAGLLPAVLAYRTEVAENLAPLS